MFLSDKLMRRAAERRPVGVCLIGAGKFGAMFLAQVPTIPGLVVRSIADLRPDAARATCRNVGWSAGRIEAVEIGDDVEAAIAAPGVEVVVEATGHPRAGVAHARMAFAKGRHVVMVNVEADALVGPALAREAEAAGVAVSMAYGDQPALIAEMVDWARCSGFGVVAAGKGTKHQPHYHASTPETVWGHYGLTPEEARKAGMNPKMFNSFLDGTKSAIEMAALANACDLDCPEDGLGFPPCGEADLARALRPARTGPAPGRRGRVEVVSSLDADGQPVPRDLRWGVFVVVEALSNYASACFAQYGVPTDPSGRFAALWRPFHMIGLELAPSILSCALDGRPTGTARAWRGDVAAIAKRDLAAGETLDGEGGFTVWGKLATAQRSAREGLCPIGLAQDVTLVRPVAAGQPVRLADIALDPADPLLAMRAGMTPAS
ncbi:MAG: NAD(P)H-dependent oxidoreductase [Rubrimonas sp.]|uniref:NAD(P)H-dependent oxidoreductase n=1 Tax=Rubrimonas sp. TaxID=2036015 RepID=UPI002FDE4BCE